MPVIGFRSRATPAGFFNGLFRGTIPTWHRTFRAAHARVRESLMAWIGALHPPREPRSGHLLHSVRCTEIFCSPRAQILRAARVTAATMAAKTSRNPGISSRITGPLAFRCPHASRHRTGDAARSATSLCVTCETLIHPGARSCGGDAPLLRAKRPARSAPGTLIFFGIFCF